MRTNHRRSGIHADTLTMVAATVLCHIREAGLAGKQTFLIALPAYLDAADIRRLQTELNRHSRIGIELQHRPGERRVEVRLGAPQHRR